MKTRKKLALAFCILVPLGICAFDAMDDKQRARYVAELKEKGVTTEVTVTDRFQRPTAQKRNRSEWVVRIEYVDPITNRKVVRHEAECSNLSREINIRCYSKWKTAPKVFPYKVKMRFLPDASSSRGSRVFTFDLQ